MSKTKVSDFFDRYACDFNAIYNRDATLLNRLISTLFRRSMKLRYTKTVEGCFPVEGKSVIDIGCGPGHYGITLAKMGAKYVCGLDFAEGMISLARQNARHHGVEGRCDFILADYMTYAVNNSFDYSIVMGFMDYVEEPKKVIEKVLSITKAKAFFSFPVDHGILAWQRRLRYKWKCDLFMYNREQLNELFGDMGHAEIEVEQVSRDFLVTVRIEKNEIAQ